MHYHAKQRKGLSFEGEGTQDKVSLVGLEGKIFLEEKLSFSKDFFQIFYVCGCFALTMYVYNMYAVPMEARRGCEPSCGCWKSNPGPLKNSQCSELLRHLFSP